jgi:hypothetical protein
MYTYDHIDVKKKPKRNMTWTPTHEDRKLIDELKAKVGVMTDSELMRMGLRALAVKEGLAA